MVDKRASMFLSFFVLLVLAFGCGQTADPRSAPTAVATPLVSVQPQRQSLERVVEQPGTVQAYEETQLFARVPGYIRLPLDGMGRILSDIGHKMRGPVLGTLGTPVQPGEILAELVVPELEEEAKLKKALIRQAEAEAEQARKAVVSEAASVAKMNASLVSARALYEHWESQFKRMSEAVKRGSIEGQIGDETLNQFKSAGAGVQAAEAAVHKAKADEDKALADVRRAEAHVDVATADALRAEAMLSYAKIRAPFDGVVTMRRVSTGDFVQPAASKGDWLFTVARLDPVRVVIAVPEADADLVKETARVALSIKAAQGPLLHGMVTRTSWALESGSRTLRTEIDMPNKDGRLRPGMYVSARIVNLLPEAWTLPASAVVKQDEALVCFLIEGGKAVRTAVRIGRADGQLVEVFKHQKAGVAATWEDFTGKENVAARAAGLKDGQVIEPGTSAK